MFDTDALRLIDAVARLGSFTRGGGGAPVHPVRRLPARRRPEARAGGPLFERLPRGGRLTPAGATLHKHTRDVLERLQRVGEELAAIHQGTGGRLQVGAFATANAAPGPGRAQGLPASSSPTSTPPSSRA